MGTLALMTLEMVSRPTAVQIVFFSGLARATSLRMEEVVSLAGAMSLRKV
jgi:hypothetical protein